MRHRRVCPPIHAKNAPVAQLDRALDYESRGQEFESLRARQISTIPNKTANNNGRGFGGIRECSDMLPSTTLAIVAVVGIMILTMIFWSSQLIPQQPRLMSLMLRFASGLDAAERK
jgi:hypothetical protein